MQDTKKADCDTIAKLCKLKKINECVVAFSAGKDSLACVVALKKAGVKTHLLYSYKYPDLRCEHDVLDYYENHFQEKVHRVPHRSFYKIFGDNLLYQDPLGVRIVEELNIHEAPTNDIVFKKYMTAQGWEKLPIAKGLKRADSMRRAVHLKDTGEITDGFIYPAANMSDRDVLAYLKRHGCKLPRIYKDIGESFDGLRLGTIRWVKKNYPDDFARLKTWLPLVELMELRMVVGTDRFIPTKNAL